MIGLSDVLLPKLLLNLLNSSLIITVHILHELDRKSMYILLLIASYKLVGV